jgi:hypothetical protein
MPVPLTGSTALVPMSRLWRPMARTDRNRERRAPGTPAPTCSPTICRGVRSDKYRSSLGFSLGVAEFMVAEPAAAGNDDLELVGLVEVRPGDGA